MGVTYSTCDHCNEPYYDGSVGIVRGECECERRWCSRACAEADGYTSGDDDEEYVGPSCKFCREEEVEDSVLLNFVLKHAKLTRKKALKLYRDRNKKKK